MALGSRFGEQVCGIAALGQLLWGTTLGSSAGGQLWGAILGSSFVQLSGPILKQLQGEIFEIEASLGCGSGYLWVAFLKNNFGDQFGDFVAALTNNYFEER